MVAVPSRPVLTKFAWHTGRPTPSVACVVQPGNPGGFQKLFFGREEIAIPLQSRQACTGYFWQLHSCILKHKVAHGLATPL